MERKSFLKSCFTVVAMVVTPFNLIAKKISRLRPNAGFIVTAGKSRSNKAITLLEGDTFFSKISTTDTDGDMYVFESTRVKEGGPAHHVHFAQDEWWYVLQGEFLIKVGEVTYHAKTGDSVFGPRMVPHSFAKIGRDSISTLKAGRRPFPVPESRCHRHLLSGTAFIEGLKCKMSHYTKIGESEGRLLMIFQPAGKMEAFFNKVSEGVAKNMSEEEQDKFREEHGFKRVGPPIKNFKKM